MPHPQPANQELATQLEAYDLLFDRWRKKNPGGCFSDFAVAQIRADLDKGRSHASLGSNLHTATDWWQAGLRPLNYVTELGKVTPESRICDYGCGSLRVGAHLIRSQLPGHYYGIDVTEDFISIGREMIGPELIAEKRPELGAIADRLDDVVAAGMDVTFAFNVACHIHPDEQETFNNRLKAICHKPGSRLLLHVVKADRPVRYQKSGWAYPLDQYLDWMRPLVPRGEPVFVATAEKAGLDFSSYLLVFDRA